jgi:uncharacterized membrane protein
MDEREKLARRASKEQIIYANILVVGVWSGIAIMGITYFLYLSNIMPPYVDLHTITTLWDKGVQEYLELTHSPHGWGWVYFLKKGDFLNYIGFVWLAVMTIVCYLVLVKGFIAKKDWLYTGIAVLEILVLSLAASGLFGSGGH